MEKNEKKTIQIGVVAVDSGKLMICDPLYLRDWKNNNYNTIREFKDIYSDKIFTYKKDFNDFSDILLENKSVKQLISENRLIEIEQTFDEQEFSYNSLCNMVNNNEFARFNFPNGKEGLALAFLSGAGDGIYPVYAETQNDEIKKVWIDFSGN